MKVRIQGRERIQARLDLVLTLLGLLVLPAILLDDIAGSHGLARASMVLDWVIWFGFAATLGALFALSPQPREFWKTYWPDLLIVLLTPPVVPDELQAFRALRLLRLL